MRTKSTIKIMRLALVCRMGDVGWTVDSGIGKARVVKGVHIERNALQYASRRQGRVGPRHGQRLVCVPEAATLLQLKQSTSSWRHFPAWQNIPDLRRTPPSRHGKPEPSLAQHHC